jgi:PAS domain S-box-containing protein
MVRIGRIGASRKAKNGNKSLPAAELENALRDARAKLQASEDRFRHLVDAITDYAVFMLDPEGNILTWNEGARRIKGYERQEIIGRNFSLLYTPEDREANRPREVLETVRREGHFEEETWRVRKDGTRFWANVVMTALRDTDGKIEGFVKVTRDQTAKHAAQESERRLERERAVRAASEAAREELERARAWLATTLFCIGEGVLATDTAGRVTMMNAVAEKLTGWTEAEAKGRPLDDVFPMISEKTRSRRPDPVSTVLRERRTVALPDQTMLRSRRGSEVPIDDSASPIIDGNGVLLGAVLVFRDQTRQREVQKERERLHDETVAALRARNTFLSSASHELRGPLSAMKLRLETLLRAGSRPGSASIPSSARELVDAAARQADKLVRLVNGLLDLSRITAGRLRLTVERMDLTDATRDVVARLRDEANGGLDIGVDAPEAIWGCWDPMRIEQVIENLVSNAEKFGKSRPVEVSVSGSAGHAHLVVRDHGVGIAPEERDRLFQPFLAGGSARRHGGLGMGLYVVDQIVRAHGGSIHVESQLGSGSTFDVELPFDASPHDGRR